MLNNCYECWFCVFKMRKNFDIVSLFVYIFFIIFIWFSYLFCMNYIDIKPIHLGFMTYLIHVKWHLNVLQQQLFVISTQTHKLPRHRPHPCRPLILQIPHQHLPNPVHWPLKKILMFRPGIYHRLVSLSTILFWEYVIFLPPVVSRWHYLSQCDRENLKSNLLLFSINMFSHFIGFLLGGVAMPYDLVSSIPPTWVKSQFLSVTYSIDVDSIRKA